jgi:hypothetical protein
MYIAEKVGFDTLSKFDFLNRGRATAKRCCTQAKPGKLQTKRRHPHGAAASNQKILYDTIIKL